MSEPANPFSPSESATPAPDGRSVGRSDRAAATAQGRQRWIVLAACAAAVVAFAVAVVVLYRGWAGGDEPNGLMVIQGAPAVADATVTLTGPALREPLKSSFSADPDYRLRFHVPPGTYHLRIERASVVLYANEQLKIERMAVLVDPWGVAKAATRQAENGK